MALTTPYLDTDADQLSHTLEAAALDALAVREVDVGPLTVELRLLGASHQVFAGPVQETVACLADGAGGLPDTAERRFPGWDYRFRACVEHLPDGRFGAEVASVRERADAAPAALCGVFPGLPDAVTALLVEPLRATAGPGVAWRTWHTYPQSHRIVTTHSRLEPR